TYAAMALPLPDKVLAPAIALAAVVTAIQLSRLATNVDDSMLMWFAGDAGLFLALFFGGVARSQNIMWNPTAEYEQCTAEALTEAAQDSCDQQYSDNLWP